MTSKTMARLVDTLALAANPKETERAKARLLFAIDQLEQRGSAKSQALHAKKRAGFVPRVRSPG